jgi:hypothetical protein
VRDRAAVELSTRNRQHTQTYHTVIVRVPGGTGVAQQQDHVGGCRLVTEGKVEGSSAPAVDRGLALRKGLGECLDDLGVGPCEVRERAARTATERERQRKKAIKVQRMISSWLPNPWRVGRVMAN